jgi:hypothetical protein
MSGLARHRSLQPFDFLMRGGKLFLKLLDAGLQLLDRPGRDRARCLRPPQYVAWASSPASPLSICARPHRIVEVAPIMVLWASSRLDTGLAQPVANHFPGRKI